MTDFLARSETGEQRRAWVLARLREVGVLRSPIWPANSGSPT